MCLVYSNITFCLLLAKQSFFIYQEKGPSGTLMDSNDTIYKIMHHIGNEKLPSGMNCLAEMKHKFYETNETFYFSIIYASNYFLSQYLLSNHSSYKN